MSTGDRKRLRINHLSRSRIVARTYGPQRLAAATRAARCLAVSRVLLHLGISGPQEGVFAILVINGRGHASRVH